KIAEVINNIEDYFKPTGDPRPQTDTHLKSLPNELVHALNFLAAPESIRTFAEETPQGSTVRFGNVEYSAKQWEEIIDEAAKKAHAGVLKSNEQVDQLFDNGALFPITQTVVRWALSLPNRANKSRLNQQAAGLEITKEGRREDYKFIQAQLIGHAVRIAGLVLGGIVSAGVVFTAGAPSADIVRYALQGVDKFFDLEAVKQAIKDIEEYFKAPNQR
ncbi:MAG: hypothetical protein AAGJ35_09630, partial [Myxococcota bacterium]